MRISFPKLALGCVLVIAGIYGIAAIREPQGWSGVSGKNKQIEQLEQENTRLAREIENKKEFLQRLQQNPEDLDFEIQKRWKLVKPKSKVFILQDGQASASAPARAPAAH